MSEGDVMIGDDLRSRAASAACRYVVSADADRIAALGALGVCGLVNQLKHLLCESSVILSCESWIDQAELFMGIGLIDRIGFDTEIVAFVRPQADYLNASWWQWSAWTDGNFEEWLYLSSFGNTCSWARFLRSWSKVDGITSVSLRLLSKDVVGPFFESLQCDRGEGGYANRSLPGVALRFLQRHRNLRRNMHDSDIDFILERALGDWDEPAPWVLPLDYVSAFLERCRPDNESLLKMLTTVEQVTMLDDRRWWDASIYRDRIVASPGILSPNADEIDAFAAALAKAARDSDAELAKLRAENLRLRKVCAMKYTADASR